MGSFITANQIDLTVVSIFAFIYILAFVAIYHMHNLKEGLLFLLYITGSIALIMVFIKFSAISAILILAYIGHLLYNNVRSEH